MFHLTLPFYVLWTFEEKDEDEDLFIHSFFHVSVYLFIHFSVCSFIYSFFDSYAYLFIHSFVHPYACLLCIRSSMYFTYLLIHSPFRVLNY